MELDVAHLGPLLEPAAALRRLRQLAEDDQVAAAGEDHLEVVPAQGFGVHQRSSTSHSSRMASTATPATARAAGLRALTETGFGP